VFARLTANAQNSRDEPGNPRHDGTSNVRRAQHLSPSDLLLEEHSDERISLRVGIRIDWIALVTRLDKLGHICRDRDHGDSLSHDAVRLSCRAD